MKKRLLITFIIAVAVMLMLTISISAQDSAKSGIFTYKGYSVSEFGENMAIGYSINYDALREYESTLGTKPELGVVFASYDMLQGQNPLDENAQPITLSSGRVLKLDIGSYESPIFDFILSGITEEYMDHKFVISAYIYDGESVSYVQGSGLSDTVTGVTFNEALEMNTLQDENGFIYRLKNDTLTVIGLDRDLDDTLIDNLYIPYSYQGYEVTAIGDEAFQEFGAKFAVSKYANLSTGFVTMFIPTSVKSIGDYAFKGFFGLTVKLYNQDGTAPDYEAWDKTVDFGEGNLSVRDCIWYFRPAIGWSRYSAAEIPEWY